MPEIKLDILQWLIPVDSANFDCEISFSMIHSFKHSEKFDIIHQTKTSFYNLFSSQLQQNTCVCQVKSGIMVIRYIERKTKEDKNYEKRKNAGAGICIGSRKRVERRICCYDYEERKWNSSATS